MIYFSPVRNQEQFYKDTCAGWKDHTQCMRVLNVWFIGLNVTAPTTVLIA